MPQPQTFLIQILVTLNPDNPTTTVIRSFYDPKIKADPLKVNVGDHIGWLVQVVVGHERKALPYTIDFSKNPSFFGVPSVSVKDGGLSPFLHVLALDDKVKYSVSIPGLITIDPDIQSGGDTTLGGPKPARVPVSYDVYWDTAHPTYVMTPLPLTVSVGDSVTFHATVGGGAMPANFTVAFDGNGWASPFNARTGSFTANGGSTTIGPLLVKDTDDPGASFPLTASIRLNGNLVSSDNPDNKITMAASGRKARHFEDE
jgi:hypothetical protein